MEINFLWRGCCLYESGKVCSWICMFPTCDPIHHMVFSDVDGKVCNLLLYIYMSINICGISTFIAFNLWILFNFYGNLWKIIYILTWDPQTLKSHMGIKDLKQTSQKDLYLHVHIFSPWVCRINFLDKDKLHIQLYPF